MPNSKINSFQENLENEVKDSVDVDQAYLDDYATLVIDGYNQRENVNPITDPTAKKNVKKRIKEEAKDARNKITTDTKKTDVIEVESDEEKEKILREQDSKTKSGDSKSIGYLDRLEILHQMRIKMLKHQIETGEYVPDNKLFYASLMVEAEMEQARLKYTDGLDDNIKAYLVKKEEKNKKEEMQLQTAIDKEFQKKVATISDYTKELHNVVKAIKEKQREFEASDKTIEEQTEYEKYIAEKNRLLGVIVSDIEAGSPETLENAMEAKKQQRSLQGMVLGEEYVTNVYERSTSEFKRALTNQRTQTAQTSKKITEENTYYKKNGIALLLEINEAHQKELRHQLNKIPETPETLEERAAIQEEINKTTLKVDKYRELENMAKNEADDNLLSNEVQKTEKSIKDETTKIEMEFSDIERTVDEINVDVATKHVEKPLESKETVEKAINAGIAAATVTYIATDDLSTQKIDGDETLAVMAGVMQYNNQKNKPATIPGIEKLVVDEEKPEEAKKYVQGNDEIEQAKDISKAERRLNELGDKK